MSEGPLHWMFGPHPWAVKHKRGLLWLLLACGWWIFGALVWLAQAGIVQDTCTSYKPHPSNCNHIVGLPTAASVVVGLVMIGLTLAMTWQAEERRGTAKLTVEDERAARAARIAAMEKELGIAPRSTTPEDADG